MNAQDEWVIVVPVDDEDYKTLLEAIWDDNRTHGTRYAPSYTGPKIGFAISQATALRIGRGAVPSAPQAVSADGGIDIDIDVDLAQAPQPEAAPEPEKAAKKTAAKTAKE